MAEPPDKKDEPADEPRARDIAKAKSTADLEEKLDPATIAQLASWFGLPSFAELEEQRAASEEAEAESPEAKELREKLAEAVNPRWLEWLYAGNARADRFRKFDHPPEPHLRERLLLFDETLGDDFRPLAEPAEYAQPVDIESALRERTPQAILRDLHRPVTHYQLYYEQDAPDGGMGAPLAEVKATVASDLRLRPNEPTGSQRVADAFAWAREIRAQKWVDLPYKRPEEPAAIGSTLPRARRDDDWDF